MCFLVVDFKIIYQTNQWFHYQPKPACVCREVGGYKLGYNNVIPCQLQCDGVVMAVASRVDTLKVNVMHILLMVMNQIDCAFYHTKL